MLANLFFALRKKDSMRVMESDWCKSSHYNTSDALSDFYLLERSLSYRLTRTFVLVVAAFFCLLLVRPYDCQAAPQIDLQAIAQIESSNRPHVVGDGGKALGLFQLHAAVIQDWNQAHPRSQKAHSDALEPRHASEVADWYLHSRIPQILRSLRLPTTTESVLTCYNMGCGAVVKGRQATAYISKYRRLTHASAA